MTRELAPSESPLVSAIVPAYNRRAETLACVESLLASRGCSLEVIVVDNASTDGTSEAIQTQFGDRVRRLRSEVNLYAGGGRNLGAAHARGRFLLFVDSDNLVAPDMAHELVEGLCRHSAQRIGLGGPFMYHADHPDRLCWTWGDIGLWSSRTYWKGQGERDTGQWANVPYVEVGHIPNVMMIEHRLFQAVGGFDPLFPMHYEESDLAERIRRRGYRCALFPRAKTWHRIPLEKSEGDRACRGDNPGLLYFAVRNRILYMRRYAGPFRLPLFMFFWSPLFLVYHLAWLVRHREPRLTGLVWRAWWDGWWMACPSPGGLGPSQGGPVS
jgi:hypothetical protein